MVRLRRTARAGRPLRGMLDVNTDRLLLADLGLIATAAVQLKGDVPGNMYWWVARESTPQRLSSQQFNEAKAVWFV